MKGIFATVLRNSRVAASVLALMAAGLAPTAALAQKKPWIVQLHYGNTNWGYNLIAIQTLYCDGTADYVNFFVGTITYTETQTYEC